jgi:hypothetical protein
MTIAIAFSSMLGPMLIKQGNNFAVFFVLCNIEAFSAASCAALDTSGDT